MSNTSSHHGGASAHNASNQGHDLSDFNWTLVLWTLPLGVIILVGFTLTCLFFFRGYHDDEARVKQGQFITTELNDLRLSDIETLSQFKVLDKDNGRIQIPIEKAMEKVVEENQNKSGRDWSPITDIYLEGAPFKVSMTADTKAVTEDIRIEEAPKPADAEKMHEKHDH